MARKTEFGISIKLLKDNFQKNLNSVKNSVKSFTSTVKGLFAGLGAIAIGRQMLQVGSDFQNAMARVKAVTNATTEQFKMMEQEAARLGATTKYTATEAANALENLTRNGLKPVQATEALSKVLQLAQANSIELAEAADLATNTMNAFGLTTKDLTRVNDVLSTTAANSATNVLLLSEALKTAAPLANNVGLSIEETNAALGTLANVGLKGSDAGTALRQTILGLSTSTPKSAKALQRYGLVINQATIQADGLGKTLEKMAKAGIGNDTQALADIFGRRGFAGASALIANYEKIISLNTTLENSNGTTARMFEQSAGEYTKAIKSLQSAWEAFVNKVFKSGSGLFTAPIKGLTQFVRSLMDLPTVLTAIGGAMSVLAVKMVSNFKNIGASAVVMGTRIKAAFGGWIGLALTAATVIGTTLVAAFRKSSEAEREAARIHGEMEAQNGKLQGEFLHLVDVLRQSEKGSAAYNYALQKLRDNYPDLLNSLKLEQISVKQSAKEYNALRNNILETIKAQQQYNKIKAALDSAEAGRNTFNEGLEQSTFSNSYGSNIASSMFSHLKRGTHQALNGRTLTEQRAESAEIINTAIRQISETSKTSGEFTRRLTQAVIEENKRVYGAQAKLDGNVTNAIKRVAKNYYNTVGQFNDEANKIQSALSTTAENTPTTTTVDNEMPVVPDATSGKVKKSTDKLADAQDDYTKSIALINRKLQENIIDETKAVQERITAIEKYISALEDELGAEAFNKQIYLQLQQSLKEQTKASEKLQQAERNYARGLEVARNRQSKAQDISTSFDNANKTEVELPKINLTFDKWETESKQLDGVLEKLNSLKQIKEQFSDEDILTLRAETDDAAAQNLVRLYDTLEDEISRLQPLADDLNKKVELGKAAEKIKELKKEYGKGLYQAINATDGAMSGLYTTFSKFNSEDFSSKDVAEQFFTITDAIFQTIDAISNLVTLWRQLSDILSTKEKIEGAISAFENVNNAVGAQEQLTKSVGAATEAVIEGNATQVASNTAAATTNIAADTAEGAAAAGKSAAKSVPFPWNIVAIAGAISAAIAAFSALPKFAEGGIFHSNSNVGDKGLARLNNNEMVLNTKQQSQLWRAISQGYKMDGPLSGKVEFHISGKSLKGVLNNYNSKLEKI